MLKTFLAAVLVSQLALAAEPDAGTVSATPPTQPFDAPVTFTDSIYAKCPEAPPLIELGNPDGGVELTADGGTAVWALLPPLRYSRHACILAACETSRAQEQTANWALVSVVGAIGVVVGAAIAGGVAAAVWPKAPVK